MPSAKKPDKSSTKHKKLISHNFVIGDEETPRLESERKGTKKQKP